MRKLKFNVVKWMGAGSPPDVAALPAAAPAPAYDAAAMGDKRACMGWTGPAGWLDEKGAHEGWGDVGYGVRAVQLIVSRRKAPHNLVLARVEALQKAEPCETKMALKRRIAQVQADLDLQALPNPSPFLVWQKGPMFGIEGNEPVCECVMARMAKVWAGNGGRLLRLGIVPPGGLTALVKGWCRGDVQAIWPAGGKITIEAEGGEGDPDTLSMSGKNARRRIEAMLLGEGRGVLSVRLGMEVALLERRWYITWRASSEGDVSEWGVRAMRAGAGEADRAESLAVWAEWAWMMAEAAATLNAQRSTSNAQGEKGEKRETPIQELQRRLQEVVDQGSLAGAKVEVKGTDADLAAMEGAAETSDSELMLQAMQVIRETKRASTSALQRRLKIGYTRAARLMDMLEEGGIIGPPRGVEPREILIELDGMEKAGREEAGSGQAAVGSGDDGQAEQA